MKNLIKFKLLLLSTGIFIISCNNEINKKDLRKGIFVTWKQEDLIISFGSENMISIENTWPDLHDIEPYDCKMVINNKDCIIHFSINYGSEKLHSNGSSLKPFLENHILRRWGIDCKDTIPTYEEVSLKNIHFGIVEACNSYSVLASINDQVNLWMDIDGELNFDEVVQILENVEVNSVR